MSSFQSALGYIPKPSYFSGLMFTFLGSMACLYVASHLPLWTHGHTFGLSSLTLAILVGIFLGNTFYSQSGSTLNAGVGYAKGQVLRLAIMLYGFKLTFDQLAIVGGKAIIVDVLTLSSTFLLACYLGITCLKMDKETTFLIGAGASICGAAAVIATEPVVKAQSYKVAIAVATVVVFGSIAMVIYPLLYQMGWLQPYLNPSEYGVYAGSSIHEVAQVVVVGNAISPEAGSSAVITKMIRVIMLAPFLLILSFVLVERSAGENIAFRHRLRQVQVPWFAFIFVGIIALHTWGDFHPDVVAMMVDIDNVLLTMAMFALGLTTHIGAIKQAGIKPLILSAVLFVWLVLGGSVINLVIQA